MPLDARFGPVYTGTMHPALTDSPFSADSSSLDSTSKEADTRAAEPRNWLVLASYHITLRIGWVFKTESVIIPAALDWLGGSGWTRGFLPLLNRLGHSIPPLLLARRLTSLSFKKWGLLFCTLGMSASMLALASMFMAGSRQAWMIPVFLTLYAVFFVFTGLSNVLCGTLQGKLIRPNRRGRLLTATSVIGCICAMTIAWMLLSIWFIPEKPDFLRSFGFSGICFFISGLTVVLLSEPADHFSETGTRLAQRLRSTFSMFRRDANFRRLALVAASLGTSMMLFPHYQSLGRGRLDLTFDHLALWVVIQNAGTAVFSLAAGPLADRSGNRAVLRCTLLGITLLPLLALAVSRSGSEAGSLYCIVFFSVGLTPITARTLTNYTLEVCASHDHPKYLSAVNLCLALPLLLSPFLGFLVDITSFEFVFSLVSILLFLGWLLTFRLEEPRHQRAQSPTL